MKEGVVICGGEAGEAWLHRSAYEGCPDAQVMGVFCADATEAEVRAGAWECRSYHDFDEILSDGDVSIVEILDLPDARDDVTGAALETGKHVLLAPPFAADADSATGLVEAARRSGSMLMSYEPWFFFPPMEKIARLVEKKSVGRVTSIRMRSLIAGKGGWDQYLNPEVAGFSPEGIPAREASISREIYEKISLAVKLLGPLEEIFFYPPVSRDGTGASVLTWKHRASLSYGALDITTAPAMEIRSSYHARDDNLELTGSSGIIWLTRACSQMRAEPTVRVFQGENMIAYGYLDDDWLSGYRACARHFADCVRYGRKPKLAPADAVYAMKCTEAAATSAAESGRVVLSI